MKLSKLSKEKRQQLVLVLLGTVAVLAALGWGLVKAQYESLEQSRATRAGTETKLQQIERTFSHSAQLKADLVQAEAALALAEADVVSGDYFASIIATLRQFKTRYQVEIPQFSPLTTETEVNLLAGCPYKQVTMTISGTARFHEFGRFLADFENRFPHMRVVNLILDPNPNVAPDQKETIAFKMDLITLVKPGVS